MISAARRGGNHPVLYEMCAAGWLPETTDMRAQFLCNPFLGAQVQVNPTDIIMSSFYKVHFDLMGEDIPVVCHMIHPFDSPDMRWRCAARGIPAPAPQSVAMRAFLAIPIEERPLDVVEPSVEALEAAIAYSFPNWKIIGREYFEPKQAA